MLVATFGSSTGWVGRTITYDDGQIALKEHGAITPADVIEYDRLGHLVWAREDLRAWVGSLAAVGTTPTSAPLASACPDVTFKFRNYDGGMSLHPKAEPWGTLALTSTGEQWELHWGLGDRESRKYIHGGLASHTIELQSASPGICRVVITSIQDPSQRAALEIPAGIAPRLQSALQEREAKLAPIRSEIVDASLKPQPVHFGWAQYLGGHPRLGKKCSGTLWFTDRQVGLGSRSPKDAALQLDEKNES